MNKTIEIIQEDKDILICYKPSGIPVQTAKFGQLDMVSWLKNYRVGKKEVPEIYIVHRLDQPVEGIMVFAKNQKAASSLSKQIQQKNVDKYYYAVVEGIPSPTQGTLENYLLRDGKRNTSKVVSPETKGAKKAILHYKVLKSNITNGKVLSEDGMESSLIEQRLMAEENLVENRNSLVEIHLETGRHHQIRVQMAAAGYPLVGDKKYNSNTANGYLPIGLCSAKLAFHHPITGKTMEFAINPQGDAFAVYSDIFVQ